MVTLLNCLLYSVAHSENSGRSSVLPSSLSVTFPAAGVLGIAPPGLFALVVLASASAPTPATSVRVEVATIASTVR